MNVRLFSPDLHSKHSTNFKFVIDVDSYKYLNPAWPAERYLPNHEGVLVQPAIRFFRDWVPQITPNGIPNVNQFLRHYIPACIWIVEGELWSILVDYISKEIESE